MSTAITRAMVRTLVAGVVCAVVSATPAVAAVRSVALGDPGLPACDAAAAAFPCGVIVHSGSSSANARVVASMTRAAGARVRYEYTSIAAVAASIPGPAALHALDVSGLDVVPDRRVTLITPPSRTDASVGAMAQTTPKGLSLIGAAPGTTTSSTWNGTGVGVAIVDTGLDLVHADLKANIATAGLDGYGGTCQDQNGHGTHVGGIVAALNNTIDTVGVAPKATLYCVRVLDASGSGSDATIIAGLDWIVTNNPTLTTKVRVVNMSLGRAGYDGDNPALSQVMDKLQAQGVSIIVAAGNDATKQILQMTPAGYNEVFAVASSTASAGTNSCKRFSGTIKQDTASYFTTDGAGVVVSAPGDDSESISSGCMLKSSGILSLKLGGGTVRMSGTSMASPHVAGVAALLYQSTPTITPACVRSKLASGANSVGTAPLDSPASSYTYDGTREGILSAPGALAVVCP